MRIVHQPRFWPQAAHDSVMALGNFDGLHRGHRAVIERARALAHAQNVPLSVMTFEPHPRRFFRPDLPVLRIVPFSQKARLLRDAGVDYLYVAHFNQAFSEMTAEAYLQFLRQDLRVAHIVTGHNFAFGHKRGGDAAYLAQQAAAQGFGYTEVGAVAGDGGVYSSSVIRDALAKGDVAAAAAVLGRPYHVRGTVIHGAQRGRTIGFPTANIRPSPLYLPRNGVYAARLKDAAGKVYDGIANLGVRPTVDGSAKRLEVHVFDAAPDLYGQVVEVTLLHFLRDERKFDGLDALQTQIATDVAATRDYFTQTDAVS